MVYLRC